MVDVLSAVDISTAESVELASQLTQYIQTATDFRAAAMLALGLIVGLLLVSMLR